MAIITPNLHEHLTSVNAQWKFLQTELYGTNVELMNLLEAFPSGTPMRESIKNHSEKTMIEFIRRQLSLLASIDITGVNNVNGNAGKRITEILTEISSRAKKLLEHLTEHELFLDDTIEALDIMIPEWKTRTRIDVILSQKNIVEKRLTTPML